jgi:hypothetical protein
MGLVNPYLPNNSTSGCISMIFVIPDEIAKNIKISKVIFMNIFTLPPILGRITTNKAPKLVGITNTKIHCGSALFYGNTHLHFF